MKGRRVEQEIPLIFSSKSQDKLMIVKNTIIYSTKIKHFYMNIIAWSTPDIFDIGSTIFGWYQLSPYLFGEKCFLKRL